jgi:hypothetical protein
MLDSRVAQPRAKNKALENLEIDTILSHSIIAEVQRRTFPTTIYSNALMQA